VPHSSDDDDRAYRSREEVAAAKAKDPLITFAQYLRDHGVLTSEKEQELNDRIMRAVNEGTENAEKAPFFDPEDTLTHVYEE
jgi:2-oxoisovalerate dehydrogenase E1 component alpha subunit